MFYELVTGEPPFQAEDAQALLRQHLLVRPPPPSQRRPDLDVCVDDLAMKALAKEPSDRFANMRELRRAFRVLLLELGVSVPASQRPPSVNVAPVPVAAPILVEEPAAQSGAYPVNRLSTDARMPTDRSELAPRTELPPPVNDTASQIRDLQRRDPSPGPGRRTMTPPMSQLNAEAAAAVAQFLAARDSAVDPEKRALGMLLERGDVDEIAARVMRLMSRVDSSSARALTLLDDPSLLAPLAESLLADFVMPTPYIERLLSRAGLAAARALWAARIRRPSTEARRMRFVSWLRTIGRPGDELLRVALGQLARRAPTQGQGDCAEDLLLALPRPLDARLVIAVEPFLVSSNPRLREIAASALMRPRTG